MNNDRRCQDGKVMTVCLEAKCQKSARICKDGDEIPTARWSPFFKKTTVKRVTIRKRVQQHEKEILRGSH